MSAQTATPTHLERGPPAMKCALLRICIRLLECDVLSSGIRLPSDLVVDLVTPVGSSTGSRHLPGVRC